MRRCGAKVFAVMLLVAMLALTLSGCSGNDKPEITSVDQLNSAEYTIAAPEGAWGMYAAEERFPEAKHVTYTSDVTAYLAVQQGKVDAYAYDRMMMEFAISNGLTGVKLLDEDIGEQIPVAVGISPKTRIPDLTGKLNAFIAEIAADGTLDDMRYRWVSTARGDMPDIPRAESPEYLLTVGTTGLVQPFSYYAEGELTGFDIELIYRFAYWLNADVTIKTFDYSGIVAAAETGGIDCIMANLNATEERKQHIGFSDTLYYSSTAVMVRETGEGKGKYAKLIDFKDARFGGTNGTVFDRFVAEALGVDPDFSFFPTVSDELSALKIGRLDAVTMDEPVAQLAVSKNPELMIFPETLKPDQYGMAFADGSPYTEEFNAVIAEFEADGTLDAIKKIWLGADDSLKVLPEQTWSGSRGTIRYFHDNTHEPMCYMGSNGENLGLELHLVLLIAEKLDYKIEMTVCTFDSLITSLESGKADLISGSMSITEEREKKVDFTDTFYKGAAVLVIRRDSYAGGKYARISDFENARFGVIDGTITGEYVKETINPNANLLNYHALTDALAALKHGRIDTVPVDEPVGLLAVSKNPELYIFSEKLIPDSYGFAFPDGSALTEQFNGVIREFEADGTLDALKALWLGADDSVKVLPEQTWPGNSGTLRYYHDNTSEPMCYVGPNGVELGYELHLLLLIAEKLDYKVEMTSATFDSLLTSLESGKADVVSGCLSITEEREKKVDFAIPHYVGATVLLLRDENYRGAEESFLEGIKNSFNSTFIVEGRWKQIAGGIGVTILLSVASGALGLLLGFGLCMLRRMRAKPSKLVSAIFVRLIQGTPVVVLLMILYHVIFGSVDISSIIVAIIGFSINFGAYTSEMMRTGIEAVDKGQSEAALAMGYGKAQTFRKFVFPQAARHFLPVLKGEFISMVKMTSIVGYIAVQDLTKVSDIIRSRTMEAFFPLIVTAIIYFVIANVMTAALSYFERRIDTGHRKRRVKGVQMQ